MEFFKIYSRVSVSDLWRKGNLVDSGFVSNETRVVFRSSSSSVLIYIQMSSEMWQIESQGDLFFEKCVKGSTILESNQIHSKLAGFMTELFDRWRFQKCSHYVSIVLCSRHYAMNVSEANRAIFPAANIDHRGRAFQVTIHCISVAEQLLSITGFLPTHRTERALRRLVPSSLDGRVGSSICYSKVDALQIKSGFKDYQPEIDIELHKYFPGIKWE